MSSPAHPYTQELLSAAPKPPARRLAHEARSLADQLMPLAVDRERLGAEVERLEAGQDVLRRQL